MIEGAMRRWLGATIAATVGAGAMGLLLGIQASGADEGWEWQAIAVGLTAGVGAAAFGGLGAGERCLIGAIGTLIGLGAFAAFNQATTWQAEDGIASEELDVLCARVKALKLCHERKIMGVFDYRDVPEGIRAEARELAKKMSQEEKLTLCDQTFGRRINRGGGAAETEGAWFAGGIRIVAALGATLFPALMRERSGRG